MLSLHTGIIYLTQQLDSKRKQPKPESHTIPGTAILTLSHRECAYFKIMLKLLQQILDYIEFYIQLLKAVMSVSTLTMNEVNLLTSCKVKQPKQQLFY